MSADLLLQWQAHPVLATLALAAGLYVWGLRRVRRWERRRTVAWMAGLAAVAVALASGVEAQDTVLLSAHMVQHLLLTMVAPPLLLLGAPVTLLLRAGGPGLRRRTLRVLGSRTLGALLHPVCGVTLFSAFMLASHLTGLYGLAARDPLVHLTEHAGFVATAMLFWAPLVSPPPLPHRLGPLGAIATLMVAMPPMVWVGMVLSGDRVRYAEYPGLADQHLAGALMLGGGVLPLLVAMFGIVWPALLREDRRAQVRLARERPA